ncbi:hypothetical protein FACS1894219_06290 [Clostridia bacterium]|nr:hypothetical protein FACS1894219_06290 [Clostridia bacterium]
MTMTPRERAIAALECRIPDEIPTFELEFQLPHELIGRNYIGGELKGTTGAERDKLLHEAAEILIQVNTKLEHSIIPIHYGGEDAYKIAKYIHELVGNKFLLTKHGDGTFSIPDGNNMYDFAYRIDDDPDGLHAEAAANMNRAIEENKRSVDAGFDSFILCSDYCYNTNPFMSPKMFSEYITPYLAGIIESIRKDGAYAIKHTDGNIMPILDQLIEANPHAIHSIDPQAGVDIKEVKALTKGRVALCGNVNCGLMQTGTDEEVRQSALYSIEHGKPDGGYIFCTSNCVFRGLPLERYRMILDVWKQNRKYG